mgnify:CR=1 FL=1
MGGGDGCGSFGFRTTLCLVLDVGLRAAEPRRKQVSRFQANGYGQARFTGGSGQSLFKIALLSIAGSPVCTSLSTTGFIGPQHYSAENLLSTPGRRAIQKAKNKACFGQRGDNVGVYKHHRRSWLQDGGVRRSGVSIVQ